MGFHTNMFERKDMLTSVNGVRGRTSVMVVNSTNMHAQTRGPYPCGESFGMELEDHQLASSAGSHWRRRMAKDDVMAAADGVNFISAMTIAAMEGTGYYKGDEGYRHKDITSYGLGAGCSFLTGKRVNQSESQSESSFCRNWDPNRLHCTSNRMDMGPCLLRDVGAIDSQFQFFKTANMGSFFDRLMDHCPFVEAISVSFTCNAGTHAAMPGSHISGHSRCCDTVAGARAT